MNTLPKAITAQWFETEDNYRTLRRHWRSLLCSERKHTLNAAHHLLYQALLGRDWRRGLTPPRNPRKLANGAFTGWALFGALARIHWRHFEAELLAPFDGLVTAEMLAALRPALPLPGPGEYRPEQFAAGAWPFEAYRLPTATPVPHD
jgi:hypothetical protein